MLGAYWLKANKKALVGSDAVLSNEPVVCRTGHSRQRGGVSLRLMDRPRPPSALAVLTFRTIGVVLALVFTATPNVSPSAPLGPGARPVARPVAGEPYLRGWIPFRAKPGDDIIIPVRLNGVDAPALLETGSPMVIIDRRLASELRLTVSRGPTLTGLNGAVPVDESRLDTLAVGLMSGKDIPVGVADFGGFDPLTGATFRAILGAKLFNWTALQVDFDHAMLRFLPPGAASGGVAVAEARLDPQSGKILTSLEINGQRIDRVEISTGQSSDLRISGDVWRRVKSAGARVTDFASADVTGIALNDYTVLPQVSIGGQMVNDVTTVIDAKPGSVLDADHVNAVLGLDLLRRFNFVLDVDGGKLVVAPRRAPDPPMPKSTTGLQGEYDAGDYRIIHVMRGSPAERAGLKDGDRICAVDHQTVDGSWAGSENGKWSTGAAGKEVELTLCSGEVKSLMREEFY